MLDNFDQYQFNRGLEDIFEYINRLNRYIVDAQPWNLAKDPANLPRLAGVLKTLSRAILSVNTLLSPVLPDTAAKVRAIFNASDLELGWQNLPEVFTINKSEQLFPRVDSKVFFAETETPPAAAPETPDEGLIEIQDFKKVQMVVARVLEAEKVEKADKLLKLKIDTGDGTRTLVAGIALFYKPEDLVGRKIIIVKNLKPAKLRGILSQGMILAASDAANRPYIPILPDDTPIGAILEIRRTRHAAIAMQVPGR